jgi:hypothetical protein
MKYMGNEPGDGFFVRGDFGISKAVVSVSVNNVSERASSESGSGYLLGVGYGIPMSSRTRLVFGINTTSRKIDSETFKSTQFTVGGLW